MSIAADELLALEHQFWGGDSAFFAAHADRRCLVAFVDMAGVMSNDDLAKTADKADRWRDMDLKQKGIVEPIKDVALLTYEVSATRAGGESYKALVSTGYVRRADGWTMMFHGHAPIEAA